MDVLIREARPEDAEAIVQIINPIIEARIYTVLDTPFSVEEERMFIENFPDRGVFHVAQNPESQKIVGFQTIEPFAVYTHAFDHVAGIGTFIDLSERRQGIGTLLSKETFKIARRKGFEKILSYVRANNRPSLIFHLKLGFRIIGTAQRQAKLGEDYLDEIFVEKFL